MGNQTDADEDGALECRERESCTRDREAQESRPGAGGYGLRLKTGKNWRREGRGEWGSELSGGKGRGGGVWLPPLLYGLASLVVIYSM